MERVLQGKSEERLEQLGNVGDLRLFMCKRTAPADLKVSNHFSIMVFNCIKVCIVFSPFSSEL